MAQISVSFHTIHFSTRIYLLIWFLVILPDKTVSGTLNSCNYFGNLLQALHPLQNLNHHVESLIARVVEGLISRSMVWFIALLIVACYQNRRSDIWIHQTYHREIDHGIKMGSMILSNWIILCTKVKNKGDCAKYTGTHLNIHKLLMAIMSG